MKKIKTDHWFRLDEESISAISEAASQAITQGEIILRASCARKWFYRYALKLEKRGFLDWNLVYGSLFHKLHEKLYTSDDDAYTVHPKESPIIIDDSMLEINSVLTPLEQTELPLVRDKVQIAFDAYRTHWYRQDSKLMINHVEETFEFEFRGLVLKAKIDMIARPNRRDGIFIWDGKTSQSIDAILLDAWTFRFQFLFYQWIYWKATGRKPTGMMINGIRKSALRPKIADRKTKRKETREEYLHRIKGDMAVNREKYFYRQRIPLGTGALERFENEMLLHHVEAFKQLQLGQNLGPLAMALNTNQCHIYKSYCEYLHLCKDGRTALGEFEQRKEKHVEFENDESIDDNAG